MNKIKDIYAVVFLVVAFFGLASSAIGANRLIVVPGYGLPPEIARTVYIKLGEHILNHAEPGTHVSVIDPVTQAVVGELVVPAGSMRARAAHKSVREQFPAMKQAFERVPEVAWQRGAVRFPETLRLIRTKIAKPDDVVTVCLVGDPRYGSGEAAYAFDGKVPRDAWLYAGAAKPRFAIAKPDTLKNWRVFLAPVPQNWSGNSDWFAGEVERFYAAFVQLQGGRFLLADQTIVWPKLATGELAEVGIRPLAPDDRRLEYYNEEMARREIISTVQAAEAIKVTTITPAPVVVTTTTPAPVTAPTVVEPPGVVSMPAMPQPSAPVRAAIKDIPRVLAGEMGIGVIWENQAGASPDCDLDLRIVVKGVPGELRYNAMRLMQGPTLVASLKKDILVAQGLSASGDPRAVYEFATIHQAVRPEDVTLFINVYKNRSRTSIAVLLLVEFGGQRWTQHIQIPATAGDSGSSPDRANSPDWMHVDLPALLDRPALGAAQ